MPLPKSMPTTVHFTEVGEAAGLHYRWHIDGPRPIDILQGIGNGCAFLDYNNDGNLDILLVGPKLALYRGDGHGHFQERTRLTHLDTFQGHFLGCAVGDYDNDGWPDLYISGYHTSLLLHNEQGKWFTDTTSARGITAQPWGTSAAFADVDGDGRLDLYVANYVDYGPQTQPRLCGSSPHKTACVPIVYKALQGVLYRNGNKRFADVTRAWGADKHSGNGLGVAFADYNDSGRLSLYVANDQSYGNLFSNPGSGPLKERGVAAGVAVDGSGERHGAMGVDWGDYDNDGRPDLFVSTFQAECKCLYHNEDNGVFTDVGWTNGIRDATVHRVAFGCKFLDADNDGRLDIILASGHIADNSLENSFRQPVQLLLNCEGTRFVDISDRSGIRAIGDLVGRGLAIGDYDNDGRIDTLMVDAEGRPRLLHNESARRRWVGFRLLTPEGRDAYGTRVDIITGNGQRLTRWCHADGSYLSSSDSRVHFGLKETTTLRSLLVRWPDGKQTAFAPQRLGCYYTVQETNRIAPTNHSAN